MKKLAAIVLIATSLIYSVRFGMPVLASHFQSKISQHKPADNNQGIAKQKQVLFKIKRDLVRRPIYDKENSFVFFPVSNTSGVDQPESTVFFPRTILYSYLITPYRHLRSPPLRA